MAFRNEFPPEAFRHAKKHLELVAFLGDVLALDEFLGEFHERWVVGGDPDTLGTAQKKGSQE